MGMMKGLYTKIQLGNRLDKHEKAFIKKYQKPKRPKTKKETNQLDFDFDLIHHPSFSD